MFGHNVTLEDREAAATIEANDVISEHRFLRLDSRFSLNKFDLGSPYRGKRLMYISDERR